ncbi:MAG TPA: sugar ABC transporter permease [Candidatus Sulfomarinibacteraceae bacterium]|nr:sugar ABC transporter permease [Candidatus Sulfomarinibacteraceae bacterium]
MAQQVVAVGSETSGSNRLNTFLRVLLSLAAAAGIFYVLRWSLAFMRDRTAPQRLLLELYTFLGMDGSAARLQESGLHPLMAKLMIMLVALAVGVLGVWILFWLVNDLADRLPAALHRPLRPYIFVGPALLLLAIYLIYPGFNTIYTSLTEDALSIPDVVPTQYWASHSIAAGYVAGELEQANGVTFEGYLLNLDQLEIARVTVNERTLWLFVRPQTITDRDSGEARRVFSITPFGLHNYQFAFTNPAMRVAFRNNVIWLLVGTGGSVILGLLIASLVDRVKREALAKSFIFMPLAISFVGASVIWRFVYAWQPPGREQIGLLNAVVTRLLGIEPIPWLIEAPLNTYALIVIMVWLQTGFCMIILSAALKSIPNEFIEAARIDGAGEWQIFFNIVIPMIRGAILTVATTVFIAVLKVFDIVYVMTNGKFDTEVIANRMFVEMFTFRNFGRAGSLAVILLVVVLPIMVINIRNLRQQGINQ